MKASDNSIEVVQWQVKYTEWTNFPKCAAAIAEKAYAEGKQDSVTYHQRRTALPTRQMRLGWMGIVLISTTCDKQIWLVGGVVKFAAVLWRDQS